MTIWPLRLLVVDSIAQRCGPCNDVSAYQCQASTSEQKLNCLMPRQRWLHPRRHQAAGNPTLARVAKNAVFGARAENVRTDLGEANVEALPVDEKCQSIAITSVVESKKPCGVHRGRAHPRHHRCRCLRITNPTNSCKGHIMEIRRFLPTIQSFLFTAAAVTALASASTGFSQTDPNPGDLLLRYTATGDNAGNLTLYFTGTGTSGTSPLSLNVLDILTLGDGNEPFGTRMPAGIPNVTEGQGGLVGGPLRIQSPTLGAASELFNTSESGVNGQYSQIYYAETNLASSFITLDKSNPGVSDTVNLGNVAAAGWSQQNIDTIFITDSFSLYNSNNFGHFGYNVTGDATGYIGSVQLLAVPEPSTLGTFTVGAISMLTVGLAGRRSRTSKKRKPL